MDREQAFQFCGAFAPKQTGGFRPDYVTPHRHRAQNRTFGSAPSSAIRRPSRGSPNRTLVEVRSHFRTMQRSFPKLTLSKAGARYGSQAISYQGTSVALSMLMVFGLHDRAGIQPSNWQQISANRQAALM
jgi:hypothetical protein